MPLSTSEPEPGRGLQGDLSRAKEGSLASAAELREFVKHLRGKSPQEVLGAVANSGLIQGVALSTVGTIILMVAFTAGPYFLYGKPKPKPSPEKTAEATTDTGTGPQATGNDIKSPPTADAKPNSQQTNAQQALDKLGETEVKAADPKVNPLDKDVDDLLDLK